MCGPRCFALFSAKNTRSSYPRLWLAWDFFLRRERVARQTLLQGALPGLVLVIGFLVFRSTLGSRMSQVDEPLGGSHVSAVLTMLSGLGWYASTILFPFGSTFDARVAVEESLSLPVLAGVAVLAALVYGLFRGPARSRLACAWFLMALVPVSNVIIPLKIPTADRFLYIPLMGLAFLAADLARRTMPHSARLAPIALLLLGVLTMSRIGDWRDDASLIAAGKRVNPKSKMLLWAEASFEVDQGQSVAVVIQGAVEVPQDVISDLGQLCRDGASILGHHQELTGSQEERFTERVANSSSERPSQEVDGVLAVVVDLDELPVRVCRIVVNLRDDDVREPRTGEQQSDEQND